MSDIQFNRVSPTIKASVTAIEIQNKKVDEGHEIVPSHILLVGESQTGYNPMQEPKEFISEESVKRVYGEDSMLYFMYKKVFQLALGYTKISCLPVKPTASAIAAQGTITIANNATSNGIITIYIGADNTQVIIVKDDTPTMIKNKIEIALQKTQDLPVIIKYPARDGDNRIYTNILPSYTLLSSISDGSFSITLDGVKQEITNLDFSSIVNWSDTESIINAKMQNITIHYDASSNRMVYIPKAGAKINAFGNAASGTEILTIINMTKIIVPIKDVNEWKKVQNGAFSLMIDNVKTEITNLDFTSAADFTAITTIIKNKIPTSAVVYNNGNLEISVSTNKPVYNIDKPSSKQFTDITQDIYMTVPQNTYIRSENTVYFECAWQGESGNTIEIDVNITDAEINQAPTGIILISNNLNGGLGAVDLSPLDTLGKTWYTIIAMPYTTADAINKINDIFTKRFDPIVNRPFIGLCTRKDNKKEDFIAFCKSANTPAINPVLLQCINPEYEAVSICAAIMAKSASTAPELPYNW